MMGDYQEKGGYVLIDPAKAGAVDVTLQVIERNAYGRLNYAPSANWSAFATGHLFGDSRAQGRRCRARIASRRTSISG